MKIRSAIALLALFAVATAVATTSYDRVNALKQELKLHNVDGKKEEAAKLAAELAKNPANEPFVQGPLQEELAALDASVSNTSLEKALNFVTGGKTEIYCEGKGLVELKGEHNDKTTSHIVLVRSNRVLTPRSFSQVESGDFAYEFSNSYRGPSISEFVIISGSPTSYHLKEVRSKTNGKTDTGEFSANWGGKKMSNSGSSSGEVLEPIPMYMAYDFHSWGNRDLGYKLKFEPGFSDTQESTERTTTKDIVLFSERSVGEAIPEYEVKDSKGEAQKFNNCFPVKYRITYKQIIDRQLVVAGKVNKEAVGRVIRKNRKQLRSCYDDALEVDSSLKGSVTLGWTINDKGRVVDPKAMSRSLTGNGDLQVRETMIQCLVDRVKTWRFLKAPQGEDVTVSYPFTFSE